MKSNGSKDAIVLEELFEGVKNRHEDFDDFPDPLVLIGHELGNWAQKTYYNGDPETAETYMAYKELLEEGEESRRELITDIERKGSTYSGIMSTGLRAIEGYIQILKGEEPGSIEVGEFMDDLYWEENINPDYDPEQSVRGNEALFIPFHTMIKNSHEYFDEDAGDLEIWIEGEDNPDTYAITYSDNGVRISEEVQDDIYEWNENSQSTGLPTAAKIIEWAGGDIEYYEEDGRYGHQVTLPKA